MFSIDWHIFFSTFVLIFVAELPDKTAFATLFLATSHHPIAVFIGACAAFVIQSIVAVAFGSVLNRLPAAPVHYVSAVLFFIFAFQMWRRKDEGEDGNGARPATVGKKLFWKSVGTAFMAVFIAEWGDLTQLATATLAAKYGTALTILISSTLALWSVTAIGVAIGHGAKHLLNPALIQRVAAVAMAGVGIYLLAAG